MTTLLQINASIHNDSGQSSRLANQFVETFRARYPQAKVVVRDVAASEPVPHLTAERFGAFITKPEERSAAQHAVVAYSDTLIEEIKQADVSGDRFADVQLRRAVAAQGVLRSHRARRRDVRLHRERAGGEAHRQESVCLRGSRRPIFRYTPGHADQLYVRDFFSPSSA